MFDMRNFVLSATVFLLTIFSPSFVYAAPGDLDATFGTGGKVTTNIDGNDLAKAVMVQPDGKILIAGSATGLILVRYNADGTLDTSYGTNGKIISSDPQTTFSLGVFQPNGKLVTANAHIPSFAQADFRRFNDDGTIDTTFGTNGLVTEPLGQSGDLSDLKIQSDGKIIAVGYALSQSRTFPVVIRLNSNGTDAGTNFIIPSGDKSLLSVFVQPDGKVLLGGYSSPGNVGFLGKFNDDGTVNAALQNTSLLPYQLIVQPDGKILVGSVTNGNIAVARYKSDLSLDTAFGVNGVAIADFGSPSGGSVKLLVQNNGAIIIGGIVSTNTDYDFALARFQPNGILDTGFGSGGKVSTSFGNGADRLFNIFSIGSNKILAVGTTRQADIDFALARYDATASTSTAHRVRFDFDGDGRSDVSVFRPSEGNWYLKQSSNGLANVRFGAGTDLIVPADYDGDGKTDVAVFRPSNGTWYLQRSTDGFSGIAFGQVGDIPVPGDFDGDGKADISVFRPSNGAWYRINSSTNQFFGVIFGQNGDLPQIADFDGDGKKDIAVFRTSNGFFYWIDSSTGQLKAVQFGYGTDIPTLADYDGDGKTDIAVFRPTYLSFEGLWYRYNSSDSQFVQVRYGQNGDIPVPADYDGNGKADIAVFRPSNGVWYFANFPGFAFGTVNDKPIPSAAQ